nr:uncharacterized protein LOC128697688 [Cherax quadricarinatus]
MYSCQSGSWHIRIQIVDNGDGVHHGDLKYLGTRHATSKCHSLVDLNSSLSYYGFRGEALASIVDMAAIVDVTTKPRGSTKTYTKLFTYGTEKSVSIAETPRPSTGTTLTVQDFMYNMPVRRKIIKEAIDIESIRKRLESFALMHPKVSFSLRNDKARTVIMQTSKSSGTMSTFLQLFGSEKARALGEIMHTVDQFTVSGYISTQPHLTKALQFVYVNKRVVLKTKIHKMLNWLLARSSIISTRLHPSSSGSGKNPSSPAKGMNLYGIFVINIECPYSEYDICLEPTKTLVEFKDWDKLLLCVEETVIKFIQEENLTISIDERYRRSGKDQEVDEEGSLPMTQSSPSLLDMFSLKRCGGESNVTGGVCQEKYGQNLCTQDNLLAIHSLPVKRAKKNYDVEMFDKTDTNEHNKDFIDKHKNAKQGNTFSNNNNSGKNIIDQVVHVDHSSPQPPSYISESEYSSLNISTISNSNCKDIPESENTNTVGMASTLEEFKNFIDNSNFESTELLRRECTSSLHQDDKNTKMQLLKKTSDIPENQECENKPKDDFTDNMSSLEEFMNFYNADKKNSELELYRTPKQAMRHTPSSPPPLKLTRSSLSAFEKMEDNSCFTSNLGSDVTQKNRKSLSETLSNQFKKHQTKTKAIQTLQNFGYQKTSVIQHMSVNKIKLPQQKDNGKRCDNIQLAVPLQREAEVNVLAAEVMQNKKINEDNIKDHNNSFRFQPVTSKNNKLENNKEYLLSEEGCRENLLTHVSFSCGSKSKRQDFPSSIRIDPCVSHLHSDDYCCNELVHKINLERSEVLPNTKNIITCSEVIPNSTLEQQDRCLISESVIAFENEKSHCQVINEQTSQSHVENESGDIERCDPVRPSSKTFTPLDTLKNNGTLSKNLTLCERRLENRILPLEKDTEHDPHLCNVSSLFHVREKNLVESCQRFRSKANITEFSSSERETDKTDCSLSCNIISSASQPSQFENFSCNNEVVQDINDTSIQESQGFTLPDLNPNLQNEKVYSSLSCGTQEENTSAAIQSSEGFILPDLSDPLCCDSSITATHDTLDKSPEKNLVISQKTNDALGSAHSTAADENGSSTHKESDQMHILHQGHKEEKHESANHCDIKSQPIRDNCSIKLLLENSIHNQISQNCDDKFEKEEQLPLCSFDIQHNTINISESSNNLAVVEGNSSFSKLTNPLSESLHFSQLTLPEDLSESQSVCQGTSSISTCDLENIESAGLALDSLSSSSEGIQKKQHVSSCEITFHGKMIHIRGGNGKLNVEKAYEDLQCTGSLETTSGNLKVSMKSPNSSCGLLNNKAEENRINDKDKSVTVNYENNNNNTRTLCSLIENTNDKSDSAQDDNSQQDDSAGNKWKEVCDTNGRKVYVHLQTGNTSYDPPPQVHCPEWTSSQPLGGPLLKVPLTHEPWHNPLGKTTADGQAFTLSHGFSAFISWKKNRDLEKKLDLSKQDKYSTRSSFNSIKNTDNIESSIKVKDSDKLTDMSEDDLLMSTEVQEAVTSLLKDCETDEDTIKWSSKPTDIHQDHSEPSKVAQVCQMWEAPKFAMDADVLTSEVQTTRGAITNAGAVVRVYNIVHPYKFSREMLQSCKVNIQYY